MGQWCSKSSAAAAQSPQKPPKASTTEPCTQDEVEDEEDTSSIQRFTNSRLGPAGSWLKELGLTQYTHAFDCAGYSDWELLGLLDEHDLQMIEMHGNLVILPGHRKKLLLASKQISAGKTLPTARHLHRHVTLDANQARNAALNMLHMNRITPLQTAHNSLGSRSMSTPVTPRNLSCMSKDMMVLRDVLPSTHLGQVLSTLDRHHSTLMPHSNSGACSHVPSTVLAAGGSRRVIINSDHAPVPTTNSRTDGGAGPAAVSAVCAIAPSGGQLPESRSCGWLDGHVDGGDGTGGGAVSPRGVGGNSLRGVYRRNQQPSSPGRLARPSDGENSSAACHSLSPRSVGRLHASSTTHIQQRFSPSVLNGLQPGPVTAPSLLGTPLADAGWLDDDDVTPQSSRSNLAAAVPLPAQHSCGSLAATPSRRAGPGIYDRTSSGRSRGLAAAAAGVDATSISNMERSAAAASGSLTVMSRAGDADHTLHVSPTQILRPPSPGGSASGGVEQVGTVQAVAVPAQLYDAWGNSGLDRQGVAMMAIPGQCSRQSPPCVNVKSPSAPLEIESFSPPAIAGHVSEPKFSQSHLKPVTPPSRPSPLPMHALGQPTIPNRILGRSVSARSAQDPSSDSPRSPSQYHPQAPPNPLAAVLSGPAPPSTASQAWPPKPSSQKPPIAPKPPSHSPAHPSSPILTDTLNTTNSQLPTENLSITFGNSSLIGSVEPSMTSPAHTPPAERPSSSQLPILVQKLPFTGPAQSSVPQDKALSKVSASAWLPVLWQTPADASQQHLQQQQQGVAQPCWLDSSDIPGRPQSAPVGPEVMTVQGIGLTPQALTRHAGALGQQNAMQRLPPSSPQRAISAEADAVKPLPGVTCSLQQSSPVETSSKGDDRNEGKARARKSSLEGKTSLLLKVQAVLSELVKAPPASTGPGRPIDGTSMSALSAPRPSVTLRAMALQREELLLLHQELEHRITQQHQLDKAILAADRGQVDSVAVSAHVHSPRRAPASACSLAGKDRGMSAPSSDCSVHDPSAALADVEKQIIQKLNELAALQVNVNLGAAAPAIAAPAAPPPTSKSSRPSLCLGASRIEMDMVGAAQRGVVTAAVSLHAANACEDAAGVQVLPGAPDMLPKSVLTVVGSCKKARNVQHTQWESIEAAAPASGPTFTRDMTGKDAPASGQQVAGLRNGRMMLEHKVDIKSELFGIEHSIDQRIQAMHDDMRSSPAKQR